MLFIYTGIVWFSSFFLRHFSFLFRPGKLRAFALAQQTGLPRLPLAKTGKRIWFHCASLGEFEQARPVMEALKAGSPDCSLVITFFSPSGYTQKQNYALADHVLYLPLDSRKNAKELQDYLQVDLAVFVKYEIWYFHLSELFKRGIPVYLLSAVFRENQFLFSRLGLWLFKLLPQFKQLFLQDEASYRLLEKRGLKNISLSGDTRYDRVKANALQVKINPHIKSFKGDHRLIVLGSSWQEEEELIKNWLNSTARLDFKIMIAPHDIGEKHINEIADLFANEKVQRYTQYQADTETRILLLDTMGHLASAYVYADIALIGGGFGKGLHNILEALAFGVPVVFGPQTDKHPEAALAIKAKVARPVTNALDFNKALNYWFNENQIEQVKLQCTDFIHVHSGASELVLKHLFEHVSAPRP